ncbi:MAG TPA: SMC family ATPase [Acidimicrobiales bacterium]|nr:SMC family ATPase [Acidimicrobiales bacterium]
MRPLSLTAEGFTAFRESVTVDFASAEFFALVGPTGSGKSSVLDAICFALYGSIPRLDDDRLVAPSITQGANEAKVSLRFELGGDEYVATRIVRRTKTGGATTKEARLECGDEVLAGEAKGMNAAVAELIGLPFDHFTRCVILPQGEFAQFLHDKPSDRQDLLVKLLDLGVYERMRRRAAQLADEKQNEVALDERMLHEHVDCTPEALEEAKAVTKAVGALREQIADAGPVLEELAAQSDAARVAAERAGQVVVLLRGVTVPKHVRSLQGERDRAVAAHVKATGAREEAEAAVAKAEAAASAAPDLAALQGVLDAYAELDSVGAHLAQIDEQVAAAAPGLSDAKAALEKASHEVVHAQQRYDAAVEDNAATALAAALVVGEPCPVCEQVVTKKPKVRPGDKDKARKRLDAARTTEGKARDAVAKLENLLSAVRGQREAAVEQQAALAKRVKSQPAPEVLTKQIADARSVRAAHETAQKAFAGAVRDERAAADVVKKFDGELDAARRACNAQRDPLVSAGLEPPHIEGELVAAWDGLVSWATAAIPEHEHTSAAQSELARERAAAVTTLFDALRQASAAVGVAGASVAELGQRAAVAERDAEREQQRIAEGMKQATKFQKKIDVVRDEIAVARELALHLRSDRFEKWLVNEALERLVLGASETLELLSGNQYALAVNEANEFEVIDHRNADDRRAAKTLSGGETFQASLALALALADQVGAMAAGGAAKLDSIFLDEGFGTLDADSLDAVASALETLGSDDRMVGIVTHVRELAERVPIRYEVVKGPRTSTITRVDT